MAFFVRGVDGLLEAFLADAADELLPRAFFCILASSFALFVNNLDLVLAFAARLGVDDLSESRKRRRRRKERKSVIKFRLRLGRSRWSG